MTRQEIKEKAKQQLGRNIFGNTWLMALVVCLIEGAILGVVAGISSFIGGVATIIVTGPLAFGVAFIFLNLARKNDGQIDLKDIFKGFTDDFGGTLLLGLLQSLFIFLWSLLFIIPGIVKSYAYAMAFYIKVDHPEYDWKACLDESQKMMKGHKMDLFVLDLSFIGWYIVGSLCLGIGTLWVSPYHYAARANFYESVKAA